MFRGRSEGRREGFPGLEMRKSWLIDLKLSVWAAEEALQFVSVQNVAYLCKAGGREDLLIGIICTSVALGGR